MLAFSLGSAAGCLYAAGAEGSASAVVVSPVGVNNGVGDVASASVTREVSGFPAASFTSNGAGDLVIHIPGASLPAPAAGSNRGAATTLSIVRDDANRTTVTLENFVKLSTGNGLLSGETASSLMMGYAYRTGVSTGIFTMTVSYN